MIKVKEIVKILNDKANPGLAEEWDNPGLQVGSMDWDVKKVLITLDVTEGAVTEAVENDVDLIISHHPMIFKALKKINDKKILKLIEHKIAVFSAHTNLDYIKGGVNSILAKKLNLKNCRFIDHTTGAELFHVSVIVPKSHMTDVANAVFNNGAGNVGDYTECLSDYEVSGQYKPGMQSNPFQGTAGVLEKVVERKLEFFVDSFNLGKVINAIKTSHPYETPAYAVYPQGRKSESFGLGFIGDLETPMELSTFTTFVKKSLKAPFVKLWKADKKDDFLVSKVAICGGSGSSLLRKVTGKADVFVSADFTYHTVLDSSVPLIDAGHFYTENPVLEVFKDAINSLPVSIMFYSYGKHEIKNYVVY